jgi:hypothetical protein
MVSKSFRVNLKNKFLEAFLIHHSHEAKKDKESKEALLDLINLNTCL